MSLPALVTGASRGIGRAIALALAERGHPVALVARSSSSLEPVAAQIRGAGGTALCCPGDLRDGAFLDRLVDEVVAAHGSLRVLVNCAGVGGRVSFQDTSDEVWDLIFETNLRAVFRLTRAALPHLVRDGGHVIMVSSLAASSPAAGMSVYGASKAALDYLTQSLMLEVRHHGVKVTTVAPGSVDTGFGGREAGGAAQSWMLEPADVAAAVLHVLAERDGAHASRVELRPARPPKR